MSSPAFCFLCFFSKCFSDLSNVLEFSGILSAEAAGGAVQRLVVLKLVVAKPGTNVPLLKCVSGTHLYHPICGWQNVCSAAMETALGKAISAQVYTLEL